MVRIITLIVIILRPELYMKIAFTRQGRWVRCIGIAKNQFAEFMNAICFNLKILVVLGSTKLVC